MGTTSHGLQDPSCPPLKQPSGEFGLSVLWRFVFGRGGRRCLLSAQVEVVVIDGFSGFKSVTGEELPKAQAVMDPYARRGPGCRQTR